MNEDFRGCIDKWGDSVKEFYFITNNTLHADNHKVADLLRKEFPLVQIDTWEQTRLAEKVWALQDN